MKKRLYLLYGVMILCIAACNGNKELQEKSFSTSSFYAAKAVTEQSSSLGLQQTEDLSEGAVYVCKSAGAKKYHFSESCRGLNNCKHPIVKISQKEAQELGLGLCGWED